MSFAKSKSSVLKENIFISYLKALIVSMLVSFALVIILAFSLKWFYLNEKYIQPLNLVIKMISVCVGAFIAVKGNSKGLIKGVLFGLLYILIAFACFSVLANTYTFDLSLFLDMLFACVVGGTVGVIKVNR